MNPLASIFSNRLVHLCDGRPGIRTSIRIEASEPADVTCAPIIDFVASDETLDRYNEIVTPSGWDLATYRRNPVFQNSHQYGDIIFTLGRALQTEVRQVAGRPALCQRVEFATASNPFARIAHGLYKGKFLNAVSAGFVPRLWEDGAPGSPWRRRYLEQELLEVSAVAIPANPNALALAYKSGVIEKSDLRELAALLNHVLTQPGPTLLSLAREIRDLISRL